VGREVEIRRREGREPARPEVVLSLEGVRTPGDRGGEALKGITLTVRSGEIVGVAGVAGNGQREPAGTIAGLRSRAAGANRSRGPARRCGTSPAGTSRSSFSVASSRGSRGC